MSKNTRMLFSNDASRFFLPWISLAMVFIAVLVLAAAVISYTSINAWNKSLSGSLTVQIPTYTDVGTPKGEILKTQIETTLTILRSSDGIMGASVLSDEQMNNLMAPWIGDKADLSALPLPKLIDVTIEAGKIPDLNQIQADLKEQVPDARLDSHRIWLKNLIDMGHGMIQLMLLLIVLLLGTLAITVIYATRTSLSVHKPVIALVHMIGAGDGYVALQYAQRSLKLTLSGSLIGFMLTLPVMWVIKTFVTSLSPDFIISFSLTFEQWLILAMVPILVPILAFITAYKTVIAYLRRFL